MRIRMTLIGAVTAATSVAAVAHFAPTAADIGQPQLDSLADLKAFVRNVGNLPAEERMKAINALRIDPRIVGGTPASIQDNPWQVALIRGYAANRYQFCGGSLIAPDIVLTAAHCIDNPIVRNDPARLDVIAGTTSSPSKAKG